MRARSRDASVADKPQNKQNLRRGKSLRRFWSRRRDLRLWRRAPVNSPPGCPVCAHPICFRAVRAQTARSPLAPPPSNPVDVRNNEKESRQKPAPFLWSRRRDLNPRPLGPEPSALPNCATPRTVNIISNRARFCKRFPCVNLSHMISFAVSAEKQLSLRLQKAHGVRNREDLQLSACCRPVPEEGGEHPRKLSFLFLVQREIVFSFREGIAECQIASHVGKKERRFQPPAPNCAALPPCGCSPRWKDRARRLTLLPCGTSG